MKIETKFNKGDIVYYHERGSIKSFEVGRGLIEIKIFTNGGYEVWYLSTNYKKISEKSLFKTKEECATALLKSMGLELGLVKG